MTKPGRKFTNGRGEGKDDGYAGSNLTSWTYRDATPGKQTSTGRAGDGSVWLEDPDVTLYHGDCLDVLRTLPDQSVHMCATSPPFYGLRDYGTGEWDGGDPDCDHPHPKAGDVARNQASSTLVGTAQSHASNGAREVCHKCGARRVDRQIGLEETPQEWCDRLVAVFREVRRVLRDDGTLWIEIGDSYAQTQIRDRRDTGPDEWGKRGGERYATGTTGNGLKAKDLLGQPWLLAKELRDPWYAGTIKQEADRVWLAAILDGEGSIGIHKRPAGQKAYSTFEKADGTTSEYVRKADSYQPKVEITNTSRALMDRVVAIAGGSCDTKQEAGTHGRKQTIYRWTVTADKARALLRELYPHLVAKQHEARLAYGCPSSDKDTASNRATAAAAHAALKQLHGGNPTGIDFPAPESLWEAGWYLRSEIIWSRLGPNPMPESVTDRPTKSHSTVFLLSKQPRYFYDADAIREPHVGNVAGTKSGISDPAYVPGEKDGMARKAWKRNNNEYNPLGANARSVWTIPTEPTPFAHFATWPQALVRRMILAGTSEQGCCPECGAPWVRQTEVDDDYKARLVQRFKPEGIAQFLKDARVAAGFKQSEVAALFPSRTGGLTGFVSNWELGKNQPTPEQWETLRAKLGFGSEMDEAIQAWHVYETGEWKDADSAYDPMSGRAPTAATRNARTVGWSPSCICSHHRNFTTTPVPCTVLDPFAGSATTMLVARNHGRHSIGIELNQQYLQIASKRLQQLSLLA